MEAIRIYKRATNQSLNQKSRCFYIGAFFFTLSAVFVLFSRLPVFPFLTVTPFTHTAHNHLHLRGGKSFWQPDSGDRDIFQAHRIATGIAYEMDMIIAVMTGGTIVPA
jgi:hypothetical protein